MGKGHRTPPLLQPPTCLKFRVWPTICKSFVYVRTESYLQRTERLYGAIRYEDGKFPFSVCAHLSAMARR